MVLYSPFGCFNCFPPDNTVPNKISQLNILPLFFLFFFFFINTGGHVFQMSSKITIQQSDMSPSQSEGGARVSPKQWTLGRASRLPAGAGSVLKSQEAAATCARFYHPHAHVRLLVSHVSCQWYYLKTVVFVLRWKENIFKPSKVPGKLPFGDM